MVPVEGLEPPRPFGHQHLKLARLPIPPHGHHRTTYMLVRSEGLEPSRPRGHGALNAARLPFRHDRIPNIHRSGDGAGGRIRTCTTSRSPGPEPGAAPVSPRPHHRPIDPSIGAVGAGSLVVVPAEGVEPPRPFGLPGLNRLRLPFRHAGSRHPAVPAGDGRGDRIRTYDPWTPRPVRYPCATPRPSPVELTCPAASGSSA